MTLESVREFLRDNAPDISVIVTEASSATVPLAAEAHGVEPDQIAKTICLRIGEDVVLVVTAGTKRLDNRKFKDRFGVKPRMLDAEAVVAATGHPVGGVCPFGLPSPLKVYFDLISNRRGEDPGNLLLQPSRNVDHDVSLSHADGVISPGTSPT